MLHAERCPEVPVVSPAVPRPCTGGPESAPLPARSATRLLGAWLLLSLEDCAIPGARCDPCARSGSLRNALTGPPSSPATLGFGSIQHSSSHHIFHWLGPASLKPPLQHKDTIPGKSVHSTPVPQTATSSRQDPSTYHGLCTSSCTAHASCSDVLLFGRTPGTTSDLLHSNTGECGLLLPRCLCLTFHTRASPSGIVHLIFTLHSACPPALPLSRLLSKVQAENSRS